MTGCHNCAHSAAIAAGEYLDLDWEQTPCSNCNVMRGGDFPFPFVDDLNPVIANESEEDDPESAAHPAGYLPLSVMQDLVVGLLKLRPELRDVVAWRFAGVRYDDIALLQGVSVQAVEKRHQRAMKLWPALRELFPRKVARQALVKDTKSGVSRENNGEQSQGG